MPHHTNLREAKRRENDRHRIMSHDDWDTITDHTGASRQEIAEAIKAVGNDREKIETYIRNRRIF